MGYGGGGHWGEDEMPSPVRTAYVITIIQALFNGLAGLMLLMASSEDIRRDADAPAQMLGILSLVIAALRVVAFMGLEEAKASARGLTIALEIVSIVGSGLGIASGNGLAVIGLSLAIVVLVQLNSDEARDWLDA